MSSVGAALPLTERDRFADMCDVLEISQSDVIRRAVRDFMRSNHAAYTAARTNPANQEALDYDAQAS